jgi:hypothetical protein
VNNRWDRAATFVRVDCFALQLMILLLTLRTLTATNSLIATRTLALQNGTSHRRHSAFWIRFDGTFTHELYEKDVSRKDAKAQSATAFHKAFSAPLRLCARKFFAQLN